MASGPRCPGAHVCSPLSADLGTSRCITSAETGGGGGRAHLQEMSQEPNLPNGQMAGPLLPSPRLHGCVLMCDVLPEGRGWPWVQPCDFSHHWAGREQGGSPPVGLSQGNPSSFRETAGTRDRAGRRHHILWVVLTNI